MKHKQSGFWSAVWRTGRAEREEKGLERKGERKRDEDEAQ